jgi:type IV pilus assembly protein PilB
MHDLLDKGTIAKTPDPAPLGNPSGLPTLLVSTYHKESVEALRDLVQLSGIKQKVFVHPVVPDKIGVEPFELLLLVCHANDDIQKARKDLEKIESLRRYERCFVLLIGPSADNHAPIEEVLDISHILQPPITPSNFRRTLMSCLTELQIRSEQPAIGSSNFSQKRKTLGEILIENGIVQPSELEEALKLQKDSGQKLGEVLVKLGMITDQERVKFLAAQMGVPAARAGQFASAEMHTVSLIPEHLARKHLCVALERHGDDLVVAMLDTNNLKLLDNLRDLTDLNIVPVLGAQEEIAKAIERYYTDISTERSATDLMADLRSEDVEYVDKKEDDEEDTENSANASAEQGIVRLVNMIIGNAVRDRASDIHVEPQDKQLTIRYRIDGELKRIMTPPRKSHQAIITRIKILSNLDIAERRVPQDGRMAVKIQGREVDVRVSILPTVYGEKAVLRILDKEAFDKAISNIGFGEDSLKVFERQIHKPYGMVIVTGPTGSGKSTTLYSALQNIKDVTKNIVTVEDPVEFHIDGVSQVHVRNKVGLTFASALRSILRQDPDIILIGEIRDQETADIAVKMALTGHLVFSTLHTNDAVSTITRFVDIGIPPLLLGSCLNLIIAQRLVRRICQHCRVEYAPDPVVLDNLKMQFPAGAKFFRGEGCVHCHGNGFTGRLPLFEMLEITPEIRRLIHQHALVQDILEAARKNGMTSIFEMGIQRVMEGQTTIEQVLAVAMEV